MALALNSNPLARTALAYLPGALVPAFAALAGTSLFARGLGPADFGRYALAGGAAALGAAGGAQWLQQAATRFLPASEDPADRAAFELGFRRLVLAVLLGGLALALFALPFAAPGWRPLLVPTALLTAATAAYNARLAPFQADADARAFSRYRILGTLLQTLLGLLAMGGGVVALVVAQALGLAILTPFMRRVDIPMAGCRGVDAARALEKFWRYGAPLGAWAATASLLAVGERYVLVWARGEAEGGLYAANAAPVVMAVTLAATPFLAAVHPRLMRAWDSGDRGRAAATLAAATKGFLVASGALALVAYLAAPLLGALLGARFAISPATVAVVALGAALGQASMLLHKPLEFAGQTRRMLVFALLAAAAKLVAMAFLAPRFGYPAAPWTTVAAYAFYGALCLQTGKNILKPSAMP